MKPSSRAVASVRLSFVAVGRNDNYGGDFLARYQCFLHQLCRQLGARSPSFEIITVEWNPMPGRASLCDLTGLRELPDNVALRFIEVPRSVHETFENSERIPVFEYIAKNVGIRRAEGDFVLATNPDILFSDPLIDFLCEEILDGAGFYRADRLDFVGAVDPRNRPDQNLRIAENSVTHAFRYRAEHGPRAGIVSDGELFTHASGDFWLAHRSVWNALRGYRELTTSAHMDSILCLEAQARGLTQHVLPASMPVFHREHSRGDRARRPETPLHSWQSLCEADDRRAHRAAWGLAGTALVERRFSPGSPRDLGLFKNPLVLRLTAPMPISGSGDR